MTTLDELLDDRLDGITTQAREVDFGRALLAFAALILMWVGRIAGAAVMALAWSYVAVRTGYRDVRPPRHARR